MESRRRYAVKDEYLSYLKTKGKDVVDYESLIHEDMKRFSHKI